MTRQFWTHERDQELAKLWADETLTTAGIGLRLDKTKSAVIARARRLGLDSRAHLIGGSERTRQNRVVYHLPKPSDRPWADVVGHIGTCQWIEGEPIDRNFCGAPAREGSSYCAEHHARCYEKEKPGRSVVRCPAPVNPHSEDVELWMTGDSLSSRSCTKR